MVKEIELRIAIQPFKKSLSLLTLLTLADCPTFSLPEKGGTAIDLACIDAVSIWIYNTL